MASPAVLTLTAVACISALPLVTVLVLLRGEEKLVSALPHLLSLAVGGLLGAAFFHLMPESIEQLGGGLRFSGGRVRRIFPLPEVQRSRVSAALLWSAAATAAVAVALPFTPLGPVFQFVPLPPAVIAGLLLLTVAYGVASEAAKRWFYRTASSGSS